MATASQQEENKESRRLVLPVPIPTISLFSLRPFVVRRPSASPGRLVAVRGVDVYTP
jgi:hypothetical protein